MNNDKQKLVNGTIIYFIGNALTSIIQILILRIITGQISSSDYGYYNMVVSIDNLITPVLTLQIADAVFRFFFDSKEEEKREYYSVAIVVTVSGILLVSLSAILINGLFYKIRNILLVLLYISSTNIFLLYQKMARCLNKNMDYVRCNILKAILYGVFQILFIFAFHLKIESLFLSSILSTFICIIILEVRIKTFKYFNIFSFKISILKEMLKFSGPLIPNTMLWWLHAAINSLIITINLGYGANGIYSAVSKFSAIITLFSSVFLLSWQESAINVYNKENAKSHYSSTYKGFFRCIVTGTPVVICFLNIAAPAFLDESYHEALKYIPLSIVATSVSALSGFFGQMYAATKKTIGAMLTSLCGVAVNLSFIFIFINKLGILAAIISVLLSNLMLYITRYFMFRKIMALKTTFLEMAISIFIISISLSVYYMNNKLVSICMFFLYCILFILANKNLIKNVINTVLRKG